MNKKQQAIGNRVIHLLSYISALYNVKKKNKTRAQEKNTRAHYHQTRYTNAKLQKNMTKEV